MSENKPEKQPQKKINESFSFEEVEQDNDFIDRFLNDPDRDNNNNSMDNKK